MLEIIVVGLLVASPTNPTQVEIEQDQSPTRLDKVEARISTLEQIADEEALARLRREAASAASLVVTDSAEDTSFSSANRSLQALNPELSLVVDSGGALVLDDFDLERAGDDSGFYFRVAGLHLEANLDPFSFVKSAIEFTPEGVELGEAYVTWTRVLPNTSLSLGKFRQQFGVVNRWHVPALDQWDYPLAMTTILGPEGLNQIGISMDWTPEPLWADSQTLTLQITNGMNEELFAGDAFAVPSILGRATGYYDIGEETYAEFGLSGMLGWNNARGMLITEEQAAYDASGQPIVLYDEDGNPVGDLSVVGDEILVDEPWRRTWLAGADATVSWAPLNRERFSGTTWRSEAYLVHKQTPMGMLRAMGGYSYLDWRLNEALVIGARADVTQPFTVENRNHLIWQGVGYLTWWQSPWVKMRLQYAHRWGNRIATHQQLTAQFVVAAGPHKHERY